MWIFLWTKRMVIVTMIFALSLFKCVCMITLGFYEQSQRRFFETKSWQPVSLPAWQKGLNVEAILFLKSLIQK